MSVEQAHRRGFAPGQILFGGDWSPEQWDRATWEEDLALMQEARVNKIGRASCRERV